MQLKHHNQASQELPTSWEHNIKEIGPPKPNYLAQIARYFGNLSISDKICGYALALCVAIGGTTVGMLAGNHYYRRTALLNQGMK